MSTPIKREDIRKGDRVRRTDEYTAEVDGHNPLPRAASFELIERPVVLPTEPGFYMTAYSPPDVFQLTDEGEWFDGQAGLSEAHVRHEGGQSLTRLRTEAETAIDLLGEVRAMYSTDDPTYWGKLDALTAKWATK